MIVDPRPVFHFLEVDDVLLFLGRPRRLRLLELELPVVHDLRDRGSRERRHLDQVEASLLRRGQRFFHGQHAQLRSVGGDHADRADPYLPVDSDARRFVVRVFDGQVPFSSTRKKKRTPAARESAFLSPVSPRDVVERGSGGEASETLEHSPSGEAAGEAHSRRPLAVFSALSLASQKRVHKCKRFAVTPQPTRDHRRSEEHTFELQSPCNLVCRLLLEKKKKTK